MAPKVLRALPAGGRIGLTAAQAGGAGLQTGVVQPASLACSGRPGRRSWLTRTDLGRPYLAQAAPPPVSPALVLPPPTSPASGSLSPLPPACPLFPLPPACPLFPPP